MKTLRDLFEKKKEDAQAKDLADDKTSTTTPKKCYRTYSQEQRKALLALVSHMSYAEIERRFLVDESTIRYWNKNSKNEDGRKSNGKTPVLDNLEKVLADDLMRKRGQGVPVTARVIIAEMKRLYMSEYSLTSDEFQALQRWARFCGMKNLKVESIIFAKSTDKIFWFDSTKDDRDTECEITLVERTQLRDSLLKIDMKLILLDHNWVHRFTHRHGFAYRKITHLSSRSAEELENDVMLSLKEVQAIRREHEIPPELILNFDETAVYFDQLPVYTYDKKGIKHPPLKCSNLSKKRLTAGLGIAATGEKLTPILIFKGTGKKTKIHKVHNNHDFSLEKNENAWMTSEIFFRYLERDVRSFLLHQRIRYKLQGRKALLVVDNFAGHNLDTKQKTQIEQDLNVIIKFLKPYTTSICQPLDLSTNSILKRKMKDEWLDWYIDPSNISKTPSKQFIYDWFAKSWNAITQTNNIKAFLLSGISNDLNGDEDILCLNLVQMKKKQAEDAEKFKSESEEAEELHERDFNTDPYSLPVHQLFEDDKPSEDVFDIEHEKPLEKFDEEEEDNEIMKRFAFKKVFRNPKK